MRWSSVAFGLAAALALAGCNTTPLGTGAPPNASCSSCHGSADNAAPPKGVDGQTDTSDIAVGAHQAHLKDSKIRNAIGCNECHPVPDAVDSPGHADGTVDLAFGALASAGGLSPSFDRDSQRCSSVWCHGALLGGGKNKKPIWTQVGTGQADCGSCHGVPPPDPHPADSNCNKCHPATVLPDGTINLSAGRHIDGKLQAATYHPAGWDQSHAEAAKSGVAACARCHGADLSGGSVGVSCDGCHSGWKTNCVFCHGGQDNQTGAPPVDTHGKSATSELTVGAHSRHLAGSAIATAMACNECHVVPADALSAGHIDGATATVRFGTLATTGGAAPSWDRAAGKCSSSYCHGATLTGGSNTGPSWAVVDGSQAACGSCHGNPPPAPHAQDGACNKCHPGTVRADGTIDLAKGLHLNGHVEAVLGHPDGWLAIHGDEANKGIAACTTCHGADLGGGTAGLSCDQCHSGWKTNCTFCHGGSDNQTGAPPVDTHKDSATTKVTIGAHSKHLADSAIAKAIACAECHQVPADALSTGHIDGPTASLAFGVLARTAGASPSWDRASARCASSYCHGATLQGGSLTAPVWTQVDGSQAACGTCHGNPPPLPHPQSASCNTCHPGTVNSSGQINVAGGQHLDGIIEANGYHPAGWGAGGVHGPEANKGLAACEACHGADLAGGTSGVSCDQCHSGWKQSCVFCHGGQDNQSGAPPVDTHGATATTAVTVGAHTAHLTASSIAQPFACSECHQVPVDALAAGHIDGPTATVSFGAIARSGGSAPSWDRASAKCSSTWCHGAQLFGGSLTAPVWTAGASQAACGACHGNPPGGSHPSGTNCNTCHPATVLANGQIDVAGGKHVDGAIEAANYHPAGWDVGSVHGPAAEQNLGSCQGCHGSDLKGGTTGVSCDGCHSGWKQNCVFCHGGTDNQTGAPPLDVKGQTSTSLPSVGAHSSHLKASAIRSAVACSECHQVPSDATSPGHMDNAVTLAFGSLAATGGLKPAFDTGTNKCSSTWCHGASISGGSNKTPVWITVNGSQAACGTCHGNPPPAPHAQTGTCNTCHAQTVLANGTIDVAGGKHIDGVVEATGAHPTGWDQGSVHGPAAEANIASCQGCHGSDLKGGTAGISCDQCHSGWKQNCVFCHGGQDNQSGAPPVDTHGATATSSTTVGAHSSHLMAKSGIASPIACTECHVVPSDALSSGHMDAATATLTFGSLATTGGLSPSWNRTTAQCSSAYCHGASLSSGSNKTPTWTTVNGTQAACGTCHGLPPTGSWSGFPEGTFSHQFGQHSSYDCSQCHPDATKTSITAPAQHINGKADINSTASGCTCHD